MTNLYTTFCDLSVILLKYLPIYSAPGLCGRKSKELNFFFQKIQGRIIYCLALNNQLPAFLVVLLLFNRKKLDKKIVFSIIKDLFSLSEIKYVIPTCENLSFDHIHIYQRYLKKLH